MYGRTDGEIFRSKWKVIYKTMKKLSIIVPVYNVENYIERCLNSILNQTWTNFEVLCVNDGSSDTSGTICEKYANRDERIKVFHKENGGAASARNVGLQHATGEYIGFVDPDDWIEPQMFESIIEKLEAHNADMGACGFFKNWDDKEIEMNNEPAVDEDVFDKEQVFYYAFKRYSYKSFGGYLWNKIFRREVLFGADALHFEETLKVGEDVLYFAQATLRAKSAVYVDKAMYHYYQRSSSLCHAGSIEERAGSLVTYGTLILLLQQHGIGENVIQYVKRFYVYIASLLAEKAYYDEDVENMQKMQKEIGKYIDAYEATSEGHEEWNVRMRLMMKNPEEAITYSRNLKDKERRNTYAKYLCEPIEENWVLYESFYGKGMVCGPYALFKAFQKRPDFQQYMHIWSISVEEELERLQEQFKDFANVKFVLRKSNEYTEYLAKSKYLINNDTFFYFFIKREGQIYLNTWHGIPMKKLGYDVPDGIIAQHNSFRNFLMTDYLLAWNGHMGDIYQRAYKLNDMYQGKIVLEGCPRNDNTLTTETKSVKSKLRNAGVGLVEGKRIILYAPTFRGTNLQTAENNYAEVKKFMAELEEKISSDEYQILYKPHHLIYDQLKKEGIKDAQVIPGYFDANEILSVTDILISDYSSIYFDFLITDRPIVFYVPDEQEYEEYRGLYFKAEKLPGAVCRTVEQVSAAISAERNYKEEYGVIHNGFKEWACSYDDGHVSQRVLKVFLGERKDFRVVEKETQEKKKKVLILADSLWDERKFEKLIETLDKYDLDTTEVTVLFNEPKTKQATKRLMSLDNRIRGLARVSAMVLTEAEELLYEQYIQGKVTINQVQEILKREHKRCLPGMKFEEEIILEF